MGNMATDSFEHERSKNPEHPEFATEYIDLEASRARELISETLKGLSATETDAGVTFRTTEGTLIARLEPETDAETGVEFQYRIAPASSVGTLKARRLWQALEPHAR